MGSRDSHGFFKISARDFELPTDVRRELYEAGASVEDAVGTGSGWELLCPTDSVGEVVGTLQSFGAYVYGVEPVPPTIDS